MSIRWYFRKRVATPWPAENRPIPTVARECHVQADTSGCAPLPISKLVFLWQSARQWYWTSVLRLLVAEIRALGHRIRWVFEIREVELHLGKDSIRTWMDRGSISGSQNYKRAYIDCMRQIEARHPFLSIFDLFLLQQAWKAGSEWNGRMDTSQSQDTSCSYATLRERRFYAATSSSAIVQK
jgi:hypothetical protein